MSAPAVDLPAREFDGLMVHVGRGKDPRYGMVGFDYRVSRWVAHTWTGKLGEYLSRDEAVAAILRSQPKPKPKRPAKQQARAL
jgi:hypothetical protein